MNNLRRSGRQPAKRRRLAESSSSSSEDEGEAPTRRPASNRTTSAPPPSLSSSSSEEEGEAHQPTQQSQQSHVTFADTATVLGEDVESLPAFSQESREGGDNQEQSSQSQAAQEEEHDVLPLAERLPAISSVIASLRTHHRVTGALSTPNVLISEQLREWFIGVFFHHEPDDDGDFWNMAWESMHDAIFDNMPRLQSQVKSCKDEYMRDIDHLITDHFSSRQFPPFTGTAPPGFAIKLQGLSQVIGWVFVDLFESLITPPRGKKVVPIETQLESCLEELASKSLSDYFSKGMDKHVYYIAGFLCHAGQTASSKRQTPIGKCIGGISTHFASESNSRDVERLKRDLPSGIAALVDKRSVHGCLSYPNVRFYSLVAKIEYCYSRLATTRNLMIFGGQALATICSSVSKHEVFVSHFQSLYDESNYSEEMIHEAFGFYLNVYSNLRLKDLCRKFNSQLHKSTTVGLRQSLAGNRGNGDRVNRRQRGELAQEPEPTEEEVHDMLVEIAENGVDIEVDNQD
jgi:hypothetical protein